MHCRPLPTALVVAFHRNAEPPDELLARRAQDALSLARDGQDSLRQAFALLAQQDFLLSGDAWSRVGQITPGAFRASSKS
jgi:hypothetical protein